ncbi:MAG: hypothetical protein ACE5FG_04140 [Myxococcota bacterium]
MSRVAGRLRAILLSLIASLYVISIPWYREPGAAPELLLGLPDWVTVALLCYAGVAVLNALAWLLTDIPEGPPGDDA